MPDPASAAAAGPGAAAVTPATGRAFVYGTLMASEVLQLLLRRVPASRAATVAGLKRCCVRGQVFPAVFPAAADERVRGRVLLGLTPREVEILDVYEAEEYRRQRVAATIVAEGEEAEDKEGMAAAAAAAGAAAEKPLPSVGEVVEADIYVWRDEYRPALDEGAEWSYEEWRRAHLAAWVARHQLEADGPDWDFAAFLSRDLEPYLRDSAEFMAEAFGGSG